MTEERETGSGNGGDGSTDDALDAWFAANFPAQPSEPAPPPSAPVPPAPVAPPVVTPPASSPPAGPFGEQPATPSAVPPATEGLPPAAELPPSSSEPPLSPTEVLADATGSSGLDALFGEAKFIEYDQGPSASENPFVRKPADAATSETSEGQPDKSAKKPQPVLLWIAGSLLAVLALGALFLLGTKLPALLGPAPGALVSPTSTPSPSATEVPLGPVKPGVYQWDDLLGGECLDPYEGAWENKYTVVDCKKPHPAQLVMRGKFPPVEGVTGYPGIEALQSQVNLLCASPAGVDYGKANAYTDLQFEASYALSEQDWFDGNEFYYCYLSRSAGGELTGSIAVPQVAPTPAASEQPAP